VAGRGSGLVAGREAGPGELRVMKGVSEEVYKPAMKQVERQVFERCQKWVSGNHGSLVLHM